MDNIKLIKNRSAGTTVYNVMLDSGAHVRRVLQPGETARVPYEELVKLSYKPGGKALLEQFLQVVDVETRDDLNLRTEPEYNMSEQDVIALLQSGTLDEFLDVLDFAPEGVIDLIKKYSVSLPLNDVPKRDALKKATGLDVAKAVAMKTAAEEDKGETGTETASTSTRRTQSKYKIVTPTQE